MQNEITFKQEQHLLKENSKTYFHNKWTMRESKRITCRQKIQYNIKINAIKCAIENVSLHQTIAVTGEDIFIPTSN